MTPVASVRPSSHPTVQYLLRLGDTCLILGQRLSEWCGHAPVLEEDLALANIALDLIGQSRHVLSRAGELSGSTGGPLLSEDELAYLRDPDAFMNVSIVELTNGPDGCTGGRDFAFAVVRNLIMSTYMVLWWEKLVASTDASIALTAEGAVKEARYHQRHSTDWLVRLGNGTDESHRRAQGALVAAWPYCAELFEADRIDEEAAASGLGPRCGDLTLPWRTHMAATIAAAGLVTPEASPERTRAKRGVHTEHLAPLLAEMQILPRQFPGGVW